MKLDEMMLDPRIIKMNYCGIIEINGAAMSRDSVLNIPKTDSAGFGVINQTSIKRDIRDYWDGTGTADVLCVKTEDSPDLKARNTRYFENSAIINCGGNIDEMKKASNHEWIDVSLFGMMMMNKSEKNKEKSKQQRESAESEGMGVVEKEHSETFSIRGAATIENAVSVLPIDIEKMNIATSFNQKQDGYEKEKSTYGSCTYYVRHGIYKFFGGISCEQARKNDVTAEKVRLLKEAFLHAFEYTPSSSRPEGSVTLRTLCWWNQERVIKKAGELKDSVTVKLKDDVVTPRSIKDYIIEVERIPGIDFGYQNYGANIKET